MARWTCPNCDREFARTGQSHTCVPGGTVADTFRERPDQRAIYERMMEHIATLGPVHVDAVKVGVFLMSDRKFAEIRPRPRGLLVYLMLSRAVDHPRALRSERIAANRMWSTLRLTDPSEVDDELLEWITLAYDEATD
jgi:Domain of unknown function (DUF5655)